MIQLSRCSKRAQIFDSITSSKKRSMLRYVQTLTGTGRRTSLLPARSAKCLYSGTPLSAAAAFATARETPRIAFAPRLAEIETNILLLSQER